MGVAALGGLLLDHLAQLALVARGLVGHALVVDGVLGGLTDHPALVIEALAPGAPGDLLEVAHGEDARLAAVVLAQLGEQHRADGHVDAHAQRVGAHDHLEQACLSELLDHQAILGQQPRVVQADAVAHVLGEVLAVGRVEAKASQMLGDGLLLVLAADVDAGQALGHLGAVALGEVDHVDRGAVLLDELGDGLLHWRLAVAELQRHGPRVGLDERGVNAGALGQVAAQVLGVAQGRAHEQEPGLAQRQQRDLPRHAPVAIAVVMKLIHDRVMHARRVALRQRHRREHLGGAGDHLGLGVDAGVAGQHADVFGAEVLAQIEELLADQGLDGAGVDRAAARREGTKVHRQGHQRLARAGGRVEDHMAALHDLEHGLLLVIVQLDAVIHGPLQEDLEQVVIGHGAGRRAVAEGLGLIRRGGVVEGRVLHREQHAP